MQTGNKADRPGINHLDQDLEKQTRNRNIQTRIEIIYTRNKKRLHQDYKQEGLERCGRRWPVADRGPSRKSGRPLPWNAADSSSLQDYKQEVEE